MKNMHPKVIEAGLSFKAVGMSAPSAVERKEALLQPAFPWESVGIVISDTVRCSTTILTALAAGARAVTVTTKGSDKGTTYAEARRVANMLDAEMVLGGELHGRPIEGGVIGNSPREVRRAGLAGKHLHFESTNFGSAYTELMPRVTAYRRAGGHATIYVGAFANLRALAKKIRANHHDRIFVVTGGFYDSFSLEDMVFGGDLLELLEIPLQEMDDEARMMVASAILAHCPKERIALLQSNLIARCLDAFGMRDDIAAALTGDGIDPTLYSLMQRIVPTVEDFGGVPAIVPNHTAPAKDLSLEEELAKEEIYA